MPEPTRIKVDSMLGDVVLEFGAAWCPICRAARPLIERALAEHPRVRHVAIEDAKGQALGRSFKVKLWPTLIFLRGGKELSRLVRPAGDDELKAAFQSFERAG